MYLIYMRNMISHEKILFRLILPKLTALKKLQI